MKLTTFPLIHSFDEIFHPFEICEEARLCRGRQGVQKKLLKIDFSESITFDKTSLTLNKWIKLLVSQELEIYHPTFFNSNKFQTWKDKPEQQPIPGIDFVQLQE